MAKNEENQDDYGEIAGGPTWTQHGSHEPVMITNYSTRELGTGAGVTFGAVGLCVSPVSDQPSKSTSTLTGYRSGRYESLFDPSLIRGRDLSRWTR